MTDRLGGVIGVTSSGMLEQLMDNITDIIYFKDRESRFIMINEAGAKWMGFDNPDEAIGKTDADVWTAAYASSARRDEQQILKTGVPLVSKLEREVRPDGSDTWVSTTKMPLRNDNGDIVGVFGVSRDVTDFKHHQEELEQIASRTEMELNLARQMQQAFLQGTGLRYPDRPLPGENFLKIAYSYKPSGEVGGDYFSLVPVSPTHAGVMIADVVGHGVDAALVMSALNALVRDPMANNKDPAAFLKQLDKRLRRLFARTDYSEFITAMYLVIDLDSEIVRFSTAGHHAAILQRKHRANPRELFEPGEFGGPALMMLDESTFRLGEIDLHHGDRLILYTDGLSELPFHNQPEKEVGINGIFGILEEHHDHDLAMLPEALMQAALTQAGQRDFLDDVCVVTLELNNPRH